jgi:hypothetical protein
MSFGGHAVRRRASFLVALDLKVLPVENNSPNRCGRIRHQFVLEKSVWNAACYSSRRMKHGDERREDAVVSEMVDSSGMQYAVIAGPRTETGPERLVIAYSNEKSLRDLIAAPSIIAVGFFSREEAVSGIRPCLPNAVACQRMQERMAGRKTERYQQGIGWAELPGDTGEVLRRLGRFLVTSYSDFITSAIVIFSSGGTLSAAIRMALGSPV